MANNLLFWLISEQEDRALAQNEVKHRNDQHDDANKTDYDERVIDQLAPRWGHDFFSSAITWRRKRKMRPKKPFFALSPFPGLTAADSLNLILVSNFLAS